MCHYQGEKYLSAWLIELQNQENTQTQWFLDFAHYFVLNQIYNTNETKKNQVHRKSVVHFYVLKKTRNYPKDSLTIFETETASNIVTKISKNNKWRTEIWPQTPCATSPPFFNALNNSVGQHAHTNCHVSTSSIARVK
jgi:hypothetical protein